MTLRLEPGPRDDDNWWACCGHCNPSPCGCDHCNTCATGHDEPCPDCQQDTP